MSINVILCVSLISFALQPTSHMKCRVLIDNLQQKERIIFGAHVGEEAPVASRVRHSSQSLSFRNHAENPEMT